MASSVAAVASAALAEGETETEAEGMQKQDQQRPLKRLKAPMENVAEGKLQKSQMSAATSNSDASPELPVEVWAHLCHYLPYTDVKNVAAVSKKMLHQVMPSITCIHLCSAYELHSSHARRMPYVECVFIYCLMKADDSVASQQHRQRSHRLIDYSRLDYCTETSYRIVPYLSCFPRLRKVFLGALTQCEGRLGRIWDGRQATKKNKTIKLTRVSTLDRGTSPHHAALVRNLSAALATGVLNRKQLTNIDGLFHHTRTIHFCGDNFRFSHRQGPRTCRECSQVIQNFPSEWLALAGGPFLCTPAKERLQQIVKRGDSHLLQGDNYLRQLFRRSFQKALEPQWDSCSVALANFALPEIKALVDLQLMDPKKVDPSIVYHALMKIRRPSNVPLQFSKRDFDALVTAGFRLDQKFLTMKEISLYQPQPQGGPGRPLYFPPIPGGAMGDIGVELNIEPLGADNPMYANIVGHVRDIIENQLGGENGFGDLSEQLFATGRAAAARARGEAAGLAAAADDGELFPGGAANDHDGNALDDDNGHEMFDGGIILSGILGPIGMPGQPPVMFGNRHGPFLGPFPFPLGGANAVPQVNFAVRGGRPDAPPLDPQQQREQPMD